MFKKAIPGALCFSLLLGGCAAAPVAVTEENAPNEIMKKAAALSSETSGEQVLSVFNELIDATVKEYGYNVAFDQTVEASNISVQNSELETITNKGRSYDVRMAGDKTVYEVLEQQSGDQQQAGFMKADSKETVTVFGTYETGGVNAANSSIAIEDITTSADSTIAEENAEDIVHNTVKYPFYPMLGANLILKPFSDPQYYDFNLTKKGNEYTLAITMKDSDAYNEALDKFTSENYGTTRTDIQGDGSFIADSYKTTAVDTVIVMNEEGVISSIRSFGNSDVTANSKSISSYTNIDCKISKAGEKLVEFVPGLFKDIAENTVKKGDTIKLP